MSNNGRKELLDDDNDDEDKEKQNKNIKEDTIFMDLEKVYHGVLIKRLYKAVRRLNVEDNYLKRRKLNMY